MAHVFDITATADTVPVDGKGAGEMAFTVTNVTAVALKGRAVIKSDSTTAGWFSLAGDAERDFAPKGTQQFTVKVAVPPAAKAGKYTFRLDAVSVKRPDEDYTQGPTVGVAVTLPPVPSKPFPWWILVAAVLAIALIGGGAYLLIPDKRVSVPDIRGKSLADATAALAKLNLQIGEVGNLEHPPADVDKVLGQDPKPPAKVAPSSRIDVMVGVARLKVPEIIGKSYAVAEQALKDAHLDLRKTTNTNRPGAAAGIVLDSDPKPGQLVHSHDPVDITVQQAKVPVPAVAGHPFTQAVNLLSAANLQYDIAAGNPYRRDITPGQPFVENVVIDQTPKPGDPDVPIGSHVKLTLPNTPFQIPPRAWRRFAIPQETLRVPIR